MPRPLLFLTFALSLIAAPPEADIRKVLDDQVLAWNRGDIPAFMTGYEDSPETTFVGKEVTKGYAGVLERYKRSYPSKEKMGTLRFSDLEVRMLGTEHALVSGRFHLDRTKEAGGEAAGIFTLTFRKTPAGWKIIVDHTS
jgi:ketosteroid isomerase-like protein